MTEASAGLESGVVWTGYYVSRRAMRSEALRTVPAGGLRSGYPPGFPPRVLSDGKKHADLRLRSMGDSVP